MINICQWLKLGGGKMLSDSRMRAFSYIWACEQNIMNCLSRINNFGSKSASAEGTKRQEKWW
jgi:hypothetical protein